MNIGDLLSYWTGGLLRSTVHRVVFPAPATKEAQTERYSIAYFCHPLDNAVLEEVPSELVKAHKKSGKAVEFEGMEDLGEGKIMTAKEHLMSRLAVRFCEIQIKLVWDTDNFNRQLMVELHDAHLLIKSARFYSNAQPNKSCSHDITKLFTFFYCVSHC